MSQVKTILHQAKRKESEPLNIVTFPTHERYQSGLANTNCIYYLWQTEGSKPWVDKYAKLPQNHILLNSKYRQQLPDHITPDLVLSQNRLAHLKAAQEISNFWNIPLISLEHTLPMPSWPEHHIKGMAQMRGHVNVFISEYNKKMWYGQPNDIVIRHGIDIDVFKPQKIKKRKVVLSVVNDWINRDEPCGFTLWKQVTNYPDPALPLFVVGDTPGLSEPAKDINELVSAYNSSYIFLNTSQVSPVPTAMMEAMSCGLPVVSTNNCMIPEVVQHGYNGFLSNDPMELRQYCIELLKNDELRNKIGENARKTIVEHFPLSKFQESWEKLFRSIVNA